MSEVIYTFPIPEDITEMLLGMVQLCQKNNVLTLRVTRQTTLEEIGPFDYTIEAGKSALYFERILGEPLQALQALELLKLLPNQELFLTATAYEWADYQRKGGLGKYLARNTDILRDIWLVIVSILTVGLTLLQILQAMGLIKTAS